MSGAEAVTAIYAVGGLVFLVALFAGAARTMARVLYYARNDTPRPKLLTRDLVTWGGFALSFGAISLIRFLPMDARIALTTGNVLWALLTTVPACVAVLYYAYCEFLVIERPKAEPEAEPA